MDCRHLYQDRCVKEVHQEMFVKKQKMEEDNLFIEANGNRERKEENFKTFCFDCDNCNKSVICLTCGYIYCSRDDLQHGYEHFQETEHCVVLDCISFETYCYKCDDEVTFSFESALLPVIESLKKLFEREDVELNDEEETVKNETKIEPLVRTTPQRARISDGFDFPMSRKDKRAMKRNKKGKVSPMFDIPYTGNVINQAASSSDDVKPKGLKNLGNTCYMNSVLQALISLPIFKNNIMPLKALMSLKPDDGSNRNLYLTDEFKILIHNLTKVNFGNSASPNDLREILVSYCPMFRGFRQHDSHEFMRYFLDQLHNEMKKFPNLGDFPEKQTLITSLFGGFLQSNVVCLKCRNCSEKVDEFMDLSLDIPRINSNKIRIIDCLNQFFEKEMLEYGEKYECSNCKQKQTSSKQMFIKRLPEILCLHVKRFRDNGAKIDSLVEFPMMNLSMDGYLTELSDDPPCVYDLSSIIVHIGYGTCSGHYIAFGKRDRTWYQFDDQQVRPAPESHVIKQRAYILLYTKRLLKPSP